MLPEISTLFTHWGRVTHICFGNLTIIGSDNGLSPGRRQAIIKTNAGTLSIGPLGTNFNEISIGIQTFSFKKMHFNMSSAKWRPFCLGLIVLREDCCLLKMQNRHTELQCSRTHWIIFSNEYSGSHKKEKMVTWPSFLYNEKPTHW